MARFTARARLLRLSMVLGILAALVLSPAASASAATAGAGFARPCITVICATPHYATITDLDAVTGVVTYPAAMNYNGKVVGRMYGASFGWHAFAWQAGVLTDLGTLATDSPRVSMALGLNPAGDVVGWSESTGDRADSAFLYRNGVMSLVFPHAGAYGINSSGQIAGYLADTAGTHHAVVFQNGTLQYAGTVTGCTYTEGNAINDSGLMTITALCSNNHMHASTWRNGTLTDLGGPYNGDSSATAVNYYGQVVGNWSENGYSHGVQYVNGAAYTLSPLPGHASSSAAAINSPGRIVGYSQDTAGLQHAVAWQNYAIQDLTAQLAPGSGWMLETATGIGDYGQIVGEGLHNGVEHGYLFTPPQGMTICC